MGATGPRNRRSDRAQRRNQRHDGATPPRAAARARSLPATPAATTGYADALARVSYFRAVPRPLLDRLAARARLRTLPAGGSLFEEGEPCRGLFVVLEGAVEVRQVSWRGREQVFHAEGPGATLGEAPLFDGGGYLATAVARAPTRALLLPRSDVLALCRQQPEVALAMLRALASRLRAFAALVSDLAFRPVTERLARYLDAAAPNAQPGTVVALPLTHAELAARLGTVRELVARAFAHLEAAGCIARRRRGVVVLDRARLAALGRGETPEGRSAPLPRSRAAAGARPAAGHGAARGSAPRRDRVSCRE